MNRVRTLKSSLEGYLFALLAPLSVAYVSISRFFLFVNAETSKTVSLDFSYHL